MKMKRERKIEEVKKIEEDLRKSTASFILDFQGLKVAELTEFRKMLRKEGARFHVVKNSLANLAIKKTRLEGLSQFFSGCSGIIFAGEDPLTSAKVIKKFMGEHSNLTIKGGVLDRNILKNNEVKKLGDLPARKVLLGQVVAGVQFPLRKLLGTLSVPLNNLILLLNLILEKRRRSINDNVSRDEEKSGKRKQ